MGSLQMNSVCSLFCFPLAATRQQPNAAAYRLTVRNSMGELLFSFISLFFFMGRSLGIQTLILFSQNLLSYFETKHL